MILEMVRALIFYSFVAFLILFLHESGHYIVHLLNGRNPSFHFWYVTFDFEPYNKFEFDLATFIGIMYGLIPIIAVEEFISPLEIFILLCGYLLCCKDDLMKLFDLKKDEETIWIITEKY